MRNKIPTANEYLDPGDLVNLGEPCRDCGSKWVIYHISVPGPNFPTGPYCYKCLLKRCHFGPGLFQIPKPMPTDLLDKLQVDLGLVPAKVIP